MENKTNTTAKTARTVVDRHEAGRILSAPPSSIQRWARTKQIPSVWISARRIRFHPDQVMTALGAERRGSSRHIHNS